MLLNHYFVHTPIIAAKKDPEFLPTYVQASFMAGAALSPLLFSWGGYDASFLTGIALKCGSLAYLVLCAREPVRRAEGDSLIPPPASSGGKEGRCRRVLGGIR